jgi:ADP-ribose pyrophosphatase YjhB (NUDIX family)
MKTDLTVAGYILNNNKTLLIYHKKIGLWLPVGGHIEENETPDEALTREIKQEVGLDIKILNVSDIPQKGNIKKQLAVPFYANVHSVGDHDHCCLFYLCESKSLEVKLKRDEVTESGWFSREQLHQDKIPIEVRNIGILGFEKYEELENAVG